MDAGALRRRRASAQLLGGATARSDAPVDGVVRHLLAVQA
ncbi:MAG: hypothetical protein JWP53_1982, partial [Conexibacter sp.]|nr:hypothetical protein [Conexibacter sp.]